VADDVTRAETVSLIDGLCQALIAAWGEVYGGETFEKYSTEMADLLPGSLREGQPSRPLVEGAADSLPLAVPPFEAGDLRADLRISVAQDGRAARVHMVLVGSPATHDEVQDPWWMSVRFESPEGWHYPDEGAAPGTHDYHHSQNSGQVGHPAGGPGTAPSERSLPSWYPDSKLAVPIPAYDPVDLVICALLSIRHPQFVYDIAAQVGTELVQRVGELLRRSGIQKVV
jgi:hypothetical protein